MTLECLYQTQKNIFEEKPCTYDHASRQIKILTGILLQGVNIIDIATIKNPLYYPSTGQISICVYFNTSKYACQDAFGKVYFAPDTGVLLTNHKVAIETMAQVDIGSSWRFFFTSPNAVAQGYSLRITFPIGFWTSHIMCNVKGLASAVQETSVMPNRRVFTCHNVPLAITAGASYEFVIGGVIVPLYEGNAQGFIVEIMDGAYSSVVLATASNIGADYASTIFPQISTGGMVLSYESLNNFQLSNNTFIFAINGQTRLYQSAKNSFYMIIGFNALSPSTNDEVGTPLDWTGWKNNCTVIGGFNDYSSISCYRLTNPTTGKYENKYKIEGFTLLDWVQRVVVKIWIKTPRFDYLTKNPLTENTTFTVDFATYSTLYSQLRIDKGTLNVYINSTYGSLREFRVHANRKAQKVLAREATTIYPGAIGYPDSDPQRHGSLEFTFYLQNRLDQGFDNANGATAYSLNRGTFIVYIYPPLNSQPQTSGLTNDPIPTSGTSRGTPKCYFNNFLLADLCTIDITSNPGATIIIFTTPTRYTFQESEIPIRITTEGGPFEGLILDSLVQRYRITMLIYNDFEMASSSLKYASPDLDSPGLGKTPIEAYFDEWIPDPIPFVENTNIWALLVPPQRGEFAQIQIKLSNTQNLPTNRNYVFRVEFQGDGWEPGLGYPIDIIIFDFPCYAKRSDGYTMFSVKCDLYPFSNKIPYIQINYMGDSSLTFLAASNAFIIQIEIPRIRISTTKDLKVNNKAKIRFLVMEETPGNIDPYVFVQSFEKDFDLYLFDVANPCTDTSCPWVTALPGLITQSLTGLQVGSQNAFSFAFTSSPAASNTDYIILEFPNDYKLTTDDRYCSTVSTPDCIMHSNTNNNFNWIIQYLGAPSISILLNKIKQPPYGGTFSIKARRMLSSKKIRDKAVFQINILPSVLTTYSFIPTSTLPKAKYGESEFKVSFVTNNALIADGQILLHFLNGVIVQSNRFPVYCKTVVNLAAALQPNDFKKINCIADTVNNNLIVQNIVAIPAGTTIDIFFRLQTIGGALGVAFAPTVDINTYYFSTNTNNIVDQKLYVSLAPDLTLTETAFDTFELEETIITQDIPTVDYIGPITVKFKKNTCTTGTQMSISTLVFTLFGDTTTAQKFTPIIGSPDPVNCKINGVRYRCAGSQTGIDLIITITPPTLNLPCGTLHTLVLTTEYVSPERGFRYPLYIANDLIPGHFKMKLSISEPTGNLEANSYMFLAPKKLTYFYGSCAIRNQNIKNLFSFAFSFPAAVPAYQTIGAGATSEGRIYIEFPTLASGVTLFPSNLGYLGGTGAPVACWFDQNTTAGYLTNIAVGTNLGCVLIESKAPGQPAIVSIINFAAITAGTKVEMKIAGIQNPAVAVGSRIQSVDFTIRVFKRTTTPRDTQLFYDEFTMFTDFQAYTQDPDKINSYVASIFDNTIQNVQVNDPQGTTPQIPYMWQPIYVDVTNTKTQYNTGDYFVTEVPTDFPCADAACNLATGYSFKYCFPEINLAVLQLDNSFPVASGANIHQNECKIKISKMPPTTQRVATQYRSNMWIDGLQRGSILTTIGQNTNGWHQLRGVFSTATFAVVGSATKLVSDRQRVEVEVTFTLQNNLPLGGSIEIIFPTEFSKARPHCRSAVNTGSFLYSFQEATSTIRHQMGDIGCEVQQTRRWVITGYKPASRGDLIKIFGEVDIAVTAATITTGNLYINTYSNRHLADVNVNGLLIDWSPVPSTGIPGTGLTIAGTQSLKIESQDLIHWEVDCLRAGHTGPLHLRFISITQIDQENGYISLKLWSDSWINPSSSLPVPGFSIDSTNPDQLVCEFTNVATGEKIGCFYNSWTQITATSPRHVFIDHIYANKNLLANTQYQLTLTSINTNDQTLVDGIKFPTVADKYKIEYIAYSTSSSSIAIRDTIYVETYGTTFNILEFQSYMTQHDMLNLVIVKISPNTQIDTFDQIVIEIPTKSIDNVLLFGSDLGMGSPITDFPADWVYTDYQNIPISFLTISVKCICKFISGDSSSDSGIPAKIICSDFTSALTNANSIHFSFYVKNPHLTTNSQLSIPVQVYSLKTDSGNLDIRTNYQLVQRGFQVNYFLEGSATNSDYPTIRLTQYVSMSTTAETACNIAPQYLKFTAKNSLPLLKTTTQGIYGRDAYIIRFTFLLRHLDPDTQGDLLPYDAVAANSACMYGGVSTQCAILQNLRTLVVWTNAATNIAAGTDVYVQKNYFWLPPYRLDDPGTTVGHIDKLRKMFSFASSVMTHAGQIIDDTVGFAILSYQQLNDFVLTVSKGYSNTVPSAHYYQMREDYIFSMAGTQWNWIGYVVIQFPITNDKVNLIGENCKQHKDSTVQISRCTIINKMSTNTVYEQYIWAEIVTDNALETRARITSTPLPTGFPVPTQRTLIIQTLDRSVQNSLVELSTYAVANNLQVKMYPRIIFNPSLWVDSAPAISSTFNPAQDFSYVCWRDNTLSPSVFSNNYPYKLPTSSAATAPFAPTYTQDLPAFFEDVHERYFDDFPYFDIATVYTDAITRAPLKFYLNAPANFAADDCIDVYYGPKFVYSEYDSNSFQYFKLVCWINGFRVKCKHDSTTTPSDPYFRLIFTDQVTGASEAELFVYITLLEPTDSYNQGLQLANSVTSTLGFSTTTIRIVFNNAFEFIPDPFIIYQKYPAPAATLTPPRRFLTLLSLTFDHRKGSELNVITIQLQLDQAVKGLVFEVASNDLNGLNTYVFDAENRITMHSLNDGSDFPCSLSHNTVEPFQPQYPSCYIEKGEYGSQGKPIRIIFMAPASVSQFIAGSYYFYLLIANPIDDRDLIMSVKAYNDVIDGFPYGRYLKGFLDLGVIFHTTTLASITTFAAQSSTTYFSADVSFQRSMTFSISSTVDGYTSFLFELLMEYNDFAFDTEDICKLDKAVSVAGFDAYFELKTIDFTATPYYIHKKMGYFYKKSSAGLTSSTFGRVYCTHFYQNPRVFFHYPTPVFDENVYLLPIDTVTYIAGTSINYDLRIKSQLSPPVISLDQHYPAAIAADVSFFMSWDLSILNTTLLNGIWTTDTIIQIQFSGVSPVLSSCFVWSGLSIQRDIKKVADSTRCSASETTITITNFDTFSLPSGDDKYLRVYFNGQSSAYVIDGRTYTTYMWANFDAQSRAQQFFYQGEVALTSAMSPRSLSCAQCITVNTLLFSRTKLYLEIGNTGGCIGSGTYDKYPIYLEYQGPKLHSGVQTDFSFTSVDQYTTGDLFVRNFGILGSTATSVNAEHEAQNYNIFPSRIKFSFDLNSLTQSSEHWFRIRIYKNTFDCYCPSQCWCSQYLIGDTWFSVKEPKTNFPGGPVLQVDSLYNSLQSLNFLTIDAQVNEFRLSITQDQAIDLDHAVYISVDRTSFEYIFTPQYSGRALNTYISLEVDCICYGGTTMIQATRCYLRNHPLTDNNAIVIYPGVVIPANTNLDCYIPEIQNPSSAANVNIYLAIEFKNNYASDSTRNKAHFAGQRVQQNFPVNGLTGSQSTSMSTVPPPNYYLSRQVGDQTTAIYQYSVSYPVQTNSMLYIRFNQFGPVLQPSLKSTDDSAMCWGASSGWATAGCTTSGVYPNQVTICKQCRSYSRRRYSVIGQIGGTRSNSIFQSTTTQQFPFYKTYTAAATYATTINIYNGQTMVGSKTDTIPTADFIERICRYFKISPSLYGNLLQGQRSSYTAEFNLQFQADLTQSFYLPNFNQYGRIAITFDRAMTLYSCFATFSNTTMFQLYCFLEGTDKFVIYHKEVDNKQINQDIKVFFVVINPINVDFTASIKSYFYYKSETDYHIMSKNSATVTLQPSSSLTLGFQRNAYVFPFAPKIYASTTTPIRYRLQLNSAHYINTQRYVVMEFKVPGATYTAPDCYIRRISYNNIAYRVFKPFNCRLVGTDLFRIIFPLASSTTSRASASERYEFLFYNLVDTALGFIQSIPIVSETRNVEFQMYQSSDAVDNLKGEQFYSGAQQKFNKDIIQLTKYDYLTAIQDEQNTLYLQLKTTGGVALTPTDWIELEFPQLELSNFAGFVNGEALKCDVYKDNFLKTDTTFSSTTCKIVNRFIFPNEGSTVDNTNAIVRLENLPSLAAGNTFSVVIEGFTNPLVATTITKYTPIDMEINLYQDSGSSTVFNFKRYNRKVTELFVIQGYNTAYTTVEAIQAASLPSNQKYGMPNTVYPLDYSSTLNFVTDWNTFPTPAPPLIYGKKIVLRFNNGVACSNDFTDLLFKDTATFAITGVPYPRLWLNRKTNTSVYQIPNFYPTTAQTINFQIYQVTNPLAYQQKCFQINLSQIYINVYNGPELFKYNSDAPYNDASTFKLIRKSTFNYNGAMFTPATSWQDATQLTQITSSYDVYGLYKITPSQKYYQYFDIMFPLSYSDMVNLRYFTKVKIEFNPVGLINKLEYCFVYSRQNGLVPTKKWGFHNCRIDNSGGQNLYIYGLQDLDLPTIITTVSSIKFRIYTNLKITANPVNYKLTVYSCTDIIEYDSTLNAFSVSLGTDYTTTNIQLLYQLFPTEAKYTLNYYEIQYKLKYAQNAASSTQKLRFYLNTVQTAGTYYLQWNYNAGVPLIDKLEISQFNLPAGLSIYQPTIPLVDTTIDCYFVEIVSTASCTKCLGSPIASHCTYAPNLYTVDSPRGHLLINKEFILIIEPNRVMINEFQINLPAARQRTEFEFKFYSPITSATYTSSDSFTAQFYYSPKRINLQHYSATLSDFDIVLLQFSPSVLATVVSPGEMTMRFELQNYEYSETQDYENRYSLDGLKQFTNGQTVSTLVYLNPPSTPLTSEMAFNYGQTTSNAYSRYHLNLHSGLPSVPALNAYLYEIKIPWIKNPSVNKLMLTWEITAIEYETSFIAPTFHTKYRFTCHKQVTPQSPAVNTVTLTTSREVVDVVNPLAHTNTNAIQSLTVSFSVSLASSMFLVLKWNNNFKNILPYVGNAPADTIGHFTSTVDPVANIQKQEKFVDINMFLITFVAASASQSTFNFGNIKSFYYISDFGFNFVQIFNSQGYTHYLTTAPASRSLLSQDPVNIYGLNPFGVASVGFTRLDFASPNINNQQFTVGLYQLQLTTSYFYQKGYIKIVFSNLNFSPNNLQDLCFVESNVLEPTGYTYICEYLSSNSIKVSGYPTLNTVTIKLRMFLQVSDASILQKIASITVYGTQLTTEKTGVIYNIPVTSVPLTSSNLGIDEFYFHNEVTRIIRTKTTVAGEIYAVPLYFKVKPKANIFQNPAVASTANSPGINPDHFKLILPTTPDLLTILTNANNVKYFPRFRRSSWNSYYWGQGSCYTASPPNICDQFTPAYDDPITSLYQLDNTIPAAEYYEYWFTTERSSINPEEGVLMPSTPGFYRTQLEGYETAFKEINYYEFCLKPKEAGRLYTDNAGVTNFFFVRPLDLKVSQKTVYEFQFKVEQNLVIADAIDVEIWLKFTTYDQINALFAEDLGFIGANTDVAKEIECVEKLFQDNSVALETQYLTAAGTLLKCYLFKAASQQEALIKIPITNVATIPLGTVITFWVNDIPNPSFAAVPAGIKMFLMKRQRLDDEFRCSIYEEWAYITPVANYVVTPQVVAAMVPTKMPPSLPEDIRVYTYPAKHSFQLPLATGASSNNYFLIYYPDNHRLTGGCYVAATFQAWCEFPAARLVVMQLINTNIVAAGTQNIFFVGRRNGYWSQSATNPNFRILYQRKSTSAILQEFSSPNDRYDPTVTLQTELVNTQSQESYHFQTTTGSFFNVASKSFFVEQHNNVVKMTIKGLMINQDVDTVCVDGQTLFTTTATTRILTIDTEYCNATLNINPMIRNPYSPRFLCKIISNQIFMYTTSQFPPWDSSFHTYDIILYFKMVLDRVNQFQYYPAQQNAYTSLGIISPSEWSDMLQLYGCKSPCTWPAGYSNNPYQIIQSHWKYWINHQRQPYIKITEFNAESYVARRGRIREQAEIYWMIRPNTRTSTVGTLPYVATLEPITSMRSNQINTIIFTINHDFVYPPIRDFDACKEEGQFGINVNVCRLEITNSYTKIRFQSQLNDDLAKLGWISSNQSAQLFKLPEYPGTHYNITIELYDVNGLLREKETVNMTRILGVDISMTSVRFGLDANSNSMYEVSFNLSHSSGNLDVIQGRPYEFYLFQQTIMQKDSYQISRENTDSEIRVTFSQYPKQFHNNLKMVKANGTEIGCLLYSTDSIATYLPTSPFTLIQSNPANYLPFDIKSRVKCIFFAGTTPEKQRPMIVVTGYDYILTLNQNWRLMLYGIETLDTFQSTAEVEVSIHYNYRDIGSQGCIYEPKSPLGLLPITLTPLVLSIQTMMVTTPICQQQLKMTCNYRFVFNYDGPSLANGNLYNYFEIQFPEDMFDSDNQWLYGAIKADDDDSSNKFIVHALAKSSTIYLQPKAAISPPGAAVTLNIYDVPNPTFVKSGTYTYQIRVISSGVTKQVQAIYKGDFYREILPCSLFQAFSVKPSSSNTGGDRDVVYELLFVPNHRIPANGNIVLEFPSVYYKLNLLNTHCILIGSQFNHPQSKSECIITKDGRVQISLKGTLLVEQYQYGALIYGVTNPNQDIQALKFSLTSYLDDDIFLHPICTNFVNAPYMIVKSVDSCELIISTGVTNLNEQSIYTFRFYCQGFVRDNTTLSITLNEEFIRVNKVSSIVPCEQGPIGLDLLASNDGLITGDPYRLADGTLQVLLRGYKDTIFQRFSFQVALKNPQNKGTYPFSASFASQRITYLSSNTQSITIDQVAITPNTLKLVTLQNLPYNSGDSANYVFQIAPIPFTKYSDEPVTQNPKLSFKITFPSEFQIDSFQTPVCSFFPFDFVNKMNYSSYLARDRINGFEYVKCTLDTIKRQFILQNVQNILYNYQTKYLHFCLEKVNNPGKYIANTFTLEVYKELKVTSIVDQIPSALQWNYAENLLYIIEIPSELANLQSATLSQTNVKDLSDYTFSLKLRSNLNPNLVIGVSIFVPFNYQLNLTQLNCSSSLFSGSISCKMSLNEIYFEALVTSAATNLATFTIKKLQNPAVTQVCQSDSTGFFKIRIIDPYALRIKYQSSFSVDDLKCVPFTKEKFEIKSTGPYLIGKGQSWNFVITLQEPCELLQLIPKTSNPEQFQFYPQKLIFNNYNVTSLNLSILVQSTALAKEHLFTFEKIESNVNFNYYYDLIPIKVKVIEFDDKILPIPKITVENTDQNSIGYPLMVRIFVEKPPAFNSIILLRIDEDENGSNTAELKKILIIEPRRFEVSALTASNLNFTITYKGDLVPPKQTLRFSIKSYKPIPHQIVPNTKYLLFEKAFNDKFEPHSLRVMLQNALPPVNSLDLGKPVYNIFSSKQNDFNQKQLDLQVPGLVYAKPLKIGITSATFEVNILYQADLYYCITFQGTPAPNLVQMKKHTYSKGLLYGYDKAKRIVGNNNLLYLVTFEIKKLQPLSSYTLHLISENPRGNDYMFREFKTLQKKNAVYTQLTFTAIVPQSSVVQAFAQTLRIDPSKIIDQTNMTYLNEVHDNYISWMMQIPEYTYILCVQSDMEDESQLSPQELVTNFQQSDEQKQLLKKHIPQFYFSKTNPVWGLTTDVPTPIYWPQAKKINHYNVTVNVTYNVQAEVHGILISNNGSNYHKPTIQQIIKCLNKTNDPLNKWHCAKTNSTVSGYAELIFDDLRDNANYSVFIVAATVLPMQPFVFPTQELSILNLNFTTTRNLSNFPFLIIIDKQLGYLVEDLLALEKANPQLGKAVQDRIRETNKPIIRYVSIEEKDRTKFKTLWEKRKKAAERWRNKTKNNGS